jgi:hypothetical protein
MGLHAAKFRFPNAGSARTGNAVDVLATAPNAPNRLSARLNPKAARS